MQSLTTERQKKRLHGEDETENVEVDIQPKRIQSASGVVDQHHDDDTHEVYSYSTEPAQVMSWKSICNYN